MRVEEIISFIIHLLLSQGEHIDRASCVVVMAAMEEMMAKIREAKANHANELRVSIADCYGSMMMNGDECMMMCRCVEQHGMMMALRETCDWPHCSFSSPFTFPSIHLQL